MDCLDLNKVTCRLCITGDEQNDDLSNLFTKTVSINGSKVNLPFMFFQSIFFAFRSTKVHLKPLN